MAMTRFAFYGNGPTNVTILGGTGVYAGVTGQVRSVSKSENVSDDTVMLNWPS
jgi:hypothetical protein